MMIIMLVKVKPKDIDITLVNITSMMDSTNSSKNIISPPHTFP